jgi:hypothetical protein
MALRDYTPSASTWLFALGVFVFSYGSAAMQYSRSNYRYNATVHPVFHPWAIAVGMLLIWLSVRKIRKTR